MIEQCVADNPHLTCPALARLLGVPSERVRSIRRRQGWGLTWVYAGAGLPFTDRTTNNGLVYRVRYGRPVRVIHYGGLEQALVNIDRLAYCLEHNGGRLPPTLKEVVFNNLEFKR